MERIPVHVILDPRAALLGAACLYWEEAAETGGVIPNESDES
jgi:hypothetical protein